MKFLISKNVKVYIYLKVIFTKKDHDKVRRKK